MKKQVLLLSFLLLNFSFLITPTGASAQSLLDGATRVENQDSPTEPTSGRAILEKQINELGEPYTNWYNQGSDELPEDFEENVKSRYQEIKSEEMTFQKFLSMEQESFLNIRSHKKNPNPPRAASSCIDMCSAGVFEDSIIDASCWAAGYGRYSTNNAILGPPTISFNPLQGVDINIAPNAYVSAPQSAPLFGNEPHHVITNTGFDPTLGGSFLSTVPSAPLGNSHAVRIGNDHVNNGYEYVSKTFTVVPGATSLTFLYALVLEDPDSISPTNYHTPTQKPSFWVRVKSGGTAIPGLVYLNSLNNTTPMDRAVANRNNPFFETKPGNDDIVYKDWDCGRIDLSSLVNQTVTVEFITTDCSHTGHFGYAYIDNLCLGCAGSSLGSLDVTVADSCITAGATIDLDYTLPAVAGSTATGMAALSFYYNGTAVSYAPTSPTLTADGTFSFAIDQDSLPCFGTGYDVVATLTYTVAGITNTITSPDPITTDGIKPGTNNDLICCQPPVNLCTEVDARVTSVGDCCYLVETSNYYPSHYTGVNVSSSNFSIATVSASATWGGVSYRDPHHAIFSAPPGGYIPVDTVGGFQPLGVFCFNSYGTGTDSLSINFLTSDTTIECTKKFEIVDCGIPVDTNCVGVMNLTAFCEDGITKMRFQVTNNSASTIRGISLYSQDTNVVPLFPFVPIADLLPGQTSPFYDAALAVANNDTNACFFFAACDQNSPPGSDGNYPSFCCMDSISYCVTLPPCGISDGACNGAIKITTSSQDSTCCYNLTLSNNYNGNIKFIEFIGVGGTQFALFSGWNIIAPVGSSRIKIEAPGGGIPSGFYPDFANFCLTGSSIAPHSVLVKYFDANGGELCTDTMNFDCDLVTPTCANIYNDSLYCDGLTTKYTFYVQNNSPFDMYWVDLRTDSNVVLSTNYIVPNPPIPVGATAGPYTVTLDTIAANQDQFCMYLSGHNGIYDPANNLAATICCTDSANGICLPMIDCSSTGDSSCCHLPGLVIPNGITPNGDGQNDVFVIGNSAICTSISITVFNRWGNKVFEEPNYTNNWGGVGKGGKLLAQGTYFILIELPDGAKEGLYIDLRY